MRTEILTVRAFRLGSNIEHKMFSQTFHVEFHLRPFCKECHCNKRQKQEKGVAPHYFSLYNQTWLGRWTPRHPEQCAWIATNLQFSHLSDRNLASWLSFFKHQVPGTWSTVYHISKVANICNSDRFRLFSFRPSKGH